MRMVINGKAWLALALLFNGAVAAFSFTFPGPNPALPIPQPTLRDVRPSLPLPSASGDAALSDLVCLRWGPVGDSTAFASLINGIEAAGGSVEIIVAPVVSEPDHLVVIGPAASPTAARRLRDELRSQSIPSQLINEAFSSPECDTPVAPRNQPARSREVFSCPKAVPIAIALSVGVFADSSAAGAFQAELAALGYPARVETLDGSRTAYHLRARSPRNPPAFGLPSMPCRTGSS